MPVDLPQVSSNPVIAEIDNNMSRQRNAAEMARIGVPPEMAMDYLQPMNCAPSNIYIAPDHYAQRMQNNMATMMNAYFPYGNAPESIQQNLAAINDLYASSIGFTANTPGNTLGKGQAFLNNPCFDRLASNQAVSQLSDLKKIGFSDKAVEVIQEYTKGVSCKKLSPDELTSMANELLKCPDPERGKAAVYLAMIDDPKVAASLSINNFIDASIKTTVLDLGLKELKNAQVFYAGGINNNEKDILHNMKQTSAILKGYNVHSIYNPDRGSYANGGEAARSMQQISNHAGIVMKYELIKYLREDPENIAYIFAHSHGTAITQNALSSLPEELRNRVSVMGIAPSKYITVAGLRDITHIASEVDIIPKFDIFGMFKSRRNTKILRPHPKAPLFDHNFLSPTYMKEKKLRCDQILKQHGIIDE